jgi:hypothetical protein
MKAGSNRREILNGKKNASELGRFYALSGHSAPKAQLPER